VTNNVSKALLGLGLIALGLAAAGAAEDCRESSLSIPCDEPFCDCNLANSEVGCEEESYVVKSGTEADVWTCIVWGEVMEEGGWYLSDITQAGCGQLLVYGAGQCTWFTAGGSLGQCICGSYQIPQPVQQVKHQFECAACELALRPRQLRLAEIIPNDRTAVAAVVQVR
jgi:hypothetical protein